jgi:hypothetical protein
MCLRYEHAVAALAKVSSRENPGFWAVPQFFEHFLSDFPNLCHTISMAKQRRRERGRHG